MSMPKRPRRPRDPNELAFQVFQEAIGEAPSCLYLSANSRPDGTRTPAGREKNPAAVALGKLGGKKGGQVRASKLSPERRSEIARRAAAARWSRKQT